MSVTQTYGANIAFIEELYEKYRSNPDAVSATWREFFRDYEPQFEEDFEEVAVAASSGGQAPSPVPPPMPAPTPVRTSEAPVLQAPPRPTAVPSDHKAVPLRGAASKIVQNMEASLAVPTATSIRNIPVKVLEENRRVINNHLALSGQSKASFTHIIAWAIVKAIKSHPRMNSAFAMQDATPARIDREDVNLGIAIDIERKDGSRSLVVPNVKRAQAIDLSREVGLVGAGAVMASPAWAHRQTQGHGLQAAWLVPGQFHALNMHRPAPRLFTDLRGRPPGTLGEEGTEAAASSDRRDGRQQSIRIAKAQPHSLGFGQESLLCALHRPGKGTTGTDGIEAVEIAELRGL